MAGNQLNLFKVNYGAALVGELSFAEQTGKKKSQEIMVVSGAVMVTQRMDITYIIEVIPGRGVGW